MGTPPALEELDGLPAPDEPDAPDAAPPELGEDRLDGGEPMLDDGEPEEPPDGM